MPYGRGRGHREWTAACPSIRGGSALPYREGTAALLPIYDCPRFPKVARVSRAVADLAYGGLAGHKGEEEGMAQLSKMSASLEPNTPVFYCCAA
jgi:hypothetical protein